VNEKTAKDKAGSPKVEVIQDDDLPEMEEHDTTAIIKTKQLNAHSSVSSGGN
jgi:hypothetical protein